MATVVAVMDRDDWGANTDNIVVVDPARACLLWVPRDLWCAGLEIRVNKAYARGGHTLLRAALAEQGVEAAHVLCLRRGAVEAALADLDVTVPVERSVSLVYPLTPLTRVQDGHRIVTFRQPQERLAGERVHQWVGARRSLDDDTGDLGRIRRQQVLVRRLLETGFPFAAAMGDPERVRVSSAEAVAEVTAVRADWRMATLDDVVPRLIAGKEVLVRRGRQSPVAWLGGSGPARLAKRALRRLLLGELAVPTSGVGGEARRTRLLALLAVRNDVE